MAYPYATSQLELALNEANGLEESQVGDTKLVRQMQAAMRMTYLAGLEKLACFDEFPWLLARLDCPGVRDRCIEQWDVGGGREAADPVAAEFLSADGPLRAHLLAMDFSGGGMSPILQAEWRSLQQCPLDDTVGESPHARMRHIQLGKRASTFAYQCTTDRLGQNLEDLQMLTPQASHRCAVDVGPLHFAIAGPQRLPTIPKCPPPQS